MRSDLYEIALIFIQFFECAVGAVELLYALLYHAFHHLVETVQVIIQARILERDRGLNGECVGQQHVILIKGAGHASTEREHPHYFVLGKERNTQPGAVLWQPMRLAPALHVFCIVDHQGFRLASDPVINVGISQ